MRCRRPPSPPIKGSPASPALTHPRAGHLSGPPLHCATIAAEGGATDCELMALFDWTTSSQATVYTAKADKKRLANQAAEIMVGNFEMIICPTAPRALEIV